MLQTIDTHSAIPGRDLGTSILNAKDSLQRSGVNFHTLVTQIRALDSLFDLLCYEAETPGGLTSLYIGIVRELRGSEQLCPQEPGARLGYRLKVVLDTVSPVLERQNILPAGQAHSILQTRLESALGLRGSA